MSNLSNLNSADFEDLVRDLIGRELGVRFEAFGPGPDGGMDGRHARGKRKTILQAKHYSGPFPALKAAMKKERSAIDRLKPKRYLLATSRQLTPPNKHSLANEIGHWLVDEGDIFSAGDVAHLLRKYPDIEKAHIKLWLSSTAVLDRVVHAAAHAHASFTREEIQQKVRVYAPNRSLVDATHLLNTRHVVIVSGPPGVGKTTLAEMLAYGHMAEDWELVPIRSLDDGLAAIVESKKQIFLFDDFLGTVALDYRTLAANDSDLARFMRRVRLSANTRFILTTRAYILEDARRLSEHLAHKQVDLSKYVLDVGIYTRAIRARILYNHIVASGTPKPYIRALIESGKLDEIVDHKNYNPRVVEWMTDADYLADIDPSDYPKQFLEGLKNPKKLWDTAFRQHIATNCKHLLITLYFCSEYGVELSVLRPFFDALHARLCQRYGVARDPNDFEDAVRVLEGSFISIRDTAVTYINPSFRDYMGDYLRGAEARMDAAAAAQSVHQARVIWNSAKNIGMTAPKLKTLAREFLPLARRFTEFPVDERVWSSPYWAYQQTDADNSTRLSLLLAWWEATHDSEYVSLAFGLLNNPAEHGGIRSFDLISDSTELISLAAELYNDSHLKEFPRRRELASAVQAVLVELFETSVALDELESISGWADAYAHGLPPAVSAALEKAIRREIENVAENVNDVDSEFTLRESIKFIERVGPSARVPRAVMSNAVDAMRRRIQRLDDENPDNEEVSAPRRRKIQGPSTFGKAELHALFAPLIE